MDRPRPTRLGAFGFTAVLALFGVSTIGRENTPAAATATARRLQPPAPPPAPLSDPVGQAATQLVNRARAAAGLPAVVEDPRLDASAAAHSADQAARQTMTHSGANGSTPGQRMQAAGFGWHTWGENVAFGQRTADEVVNAWLTSAPHRANILNPAFTSIGTASAAGPNGSIYWTMDLAA